MGPLQAADIGPTVLLVSLDGFRWDYFGRADTPNLDRLIHEGTRAKALIPVFPSETFPNHYSQVTGLYPEHHGIVSNVMYDPEFDDTFKLGKNEAVTDGRWWGGEPIWVTAAKQGMKSATYFWPGSEAEIAGHRPTYWKPYNNDVPLSQRVKQILDWLDLPPEERPALLTLYFSLVDSAGHNFGPDSPQVNEAIAKADHALGTLIAGLERRGLLGRIHLLVVSDHGMTPLSPDRVIYLDDYIDLSTVQVVDWSPNLALRPKPGREEEVHSALKNAHPHLKVYRREEIPERLHYRAHRRIAPILGLADEGWQIRRKGLIDKALIQAKKGSHGYDTAFPSMNGIFIGHGPRFEKGRSVDAFECVHLYNLMCLILGLEAAPNDGDVGMAQSILKAD